MLKLSLLEFILRTIPESFLIILAVHLLNCKKIEPKTYIISSIFIAISTYLVRLLPIHYGVHTIINMVIYILVATSINNINAIKAGSSVLEVIITISICEWINVAVLDNVMKLDLQVIFSEPLRKILYSTPSLVMFGITVFLFYKFRVKTRMELINEYN